MILSQPTTSWETSSTAPYQSQAAFAIISAAVAFLLLPSLHQRMPCCPFYAVPHIHVYSYS